MLGKKCTVELIIKLVIDGYDLERVAKQSSFNLINFYHMCGNDKEYEKYKSKDFSEFEFLNYVLNEKNKKYRER